MVVDLSCVDLEELQRHLETHRHQSETSHGQLLQQLSQQLENTARIMEANNKTSANTLTTTLSTTLQNTVQQQLNHSLDLYVVLPWLCKCMQYGTIYTNVTCLSRN